MFRSYAALAALLLSVASASAAPFAQWFDVTLPDGSAARIWGEGDEFDAHFRTEDGRTVVYNGTVGRYEYVEKDEESGALRGVDVFLGDETAKAGVLAALPAGDLYDTSDAHVTAAVAKAEAWDEAMGISKSWEELKEKNERARAAGAEGPLRTQTTVGTMVGFTMLVDFPLLDANGNVTNTLATVRGERDQYGPNYIRAMMNEEGWHADGNVASVRDYFYEMSCGNLVYTNVVTEWITLPHERSYYDVSTEDCGACGRRMVGDALAVIKASSDFEKKYVPMLQALSLSNGSSGYALAFNVLFAGGPASSWDYGLWAHSWSLAYSQYSQCYWKNPRGTDSYFYNYQITALRSGGSAPVIGTLCHEDGHMICRFPDYYQYSKMSFQSVKGEGVGEWSLMCSANHLGGGAKPGAADCYSRYHAGWVEPIDITLDQGWVYVTNSYDSVYRYVNPANSREAFFFENRQKDGIDAGLTHGGLLIWRTKWAGNTDTDSANKSPSSLKSYFQNLTTDALAATNRLSNELSLEQANGSYHLERGQSRSYETDPWYAGNGAGSVSNIRNSGYKGVWNDDTVTCSRWSDGTPSGLRISHISECGQVMRFFVGDPATWPEPFVEIRLKSALGEVATFTATVESWGSGNSSIDVYAEIGSDANFSSVLSSTKIGTMTQLNTDKDWQIGELAIGTPHYVRLKLKNSAGEFTSPVAALDFTLDENIPTAVDAPHVLFWQSPGNPKNWFVATDKTHKGSTSAKSGKITHNQTTTLNATVTGPGTFSFWWNASSENVSYDWHAYTTSWNPATTNKIGGTSANWAQVTLQVPAGSQTITWSYRKDGSVDGGSDCAWLDDVVWRPDAAAPVLTAAAAGDPGVSAVDVAWTLENLSTGATSCNLFLEYSTSSTFSGATTVPIGSATDAASGTWTLTGLSAGTTYYVRAKAVSNTNKTGYSEPFTVATANPAFPDFTFSVAPSETVTRGVVTINVSSFGTSSSSATATIEYATSSDFAGAKTETASLTHTGATNVELTRLSAGTTYYVRVTVRNGQGKSFTRGPKTFKTGDAGFYQPGLAQVRYKYSPNAKTYPDFTVTVANNTSTYAIERAPGPFMADIYGSSAGVKTVNPYTGTEWDWQNYTVYYYEGEMFFKGGVTYNFFHCVDDGVAIELDGEWLTRQSASNKSGYDEGVTRASKAFETDGWHAIRIWVYEWEGGKGYVQKNIGFAGIGLGWNTNGCTTVNAANQSNWSTLRDPGDASLLRTLSGAELPSFVTLADDLRISGTTLTGTIHTDGVEDGCTVTLYAGQTNAGSNTVGWAQSHVAGTVPSESYDLPFQWDDFCDAGDVSGWYVIARMTNASGTYEGWSAVREPLVGNVFVVGIQEGESGLNTITATPRVVGFGAGAESATLCLEYATDANFANAQTTAGATATTTNWLAAVTITGLSPNTLYYVRTKGVKGSETVYSRAAQISTRDYGTPAGTIAVGTTTLSTIPLTWSVTGLGLGNTSADVFLDYGTSASYGQSIKLDTVTGEKSGTYTLEGLPGETTYHVRLRIVASPSGKVGTTDDAAGTTKPVGNPVVSATLGTVAQYSATLSYNLTNLGEGAASASLYYDVSTSSTFPSGSTTSTAIQNGITPAVLPKTGTATVTGLSPETTYYVRVRAVNHAGKVGMSATMTVNTTAVGNPVVAVDMASVLQRTATAAISIATLGDAAASGTITVEYGTSTAYGKTVAVSGAVEAGAVLTAVFADLQPETTYYVRVTVKNDANKTGVATTSFRTLEPADPAFTYTVTPSYTAASFALNVTKIGNGATSAAGYVRWSATSALSPELGRAPIARVVSVPASVSVAATGLSSSTTYHYEVVVTNNLAGETRETGSFTTLSPGNLAWGEGYWQGGLLQGYNKGNGQQWGLAVGKASAQAARWNSSGYEASFAYGAVASYQAKSTSNWTNPYDGATYPMDSYNRMWAYGGQMWMEKGVTYYFAVNFFFAASISIDGEVVCSEENGGNGTPQVGSVTPTTTGWHDIAIAVGSNGNGAGACGNPWNTGSPFTSLRYGTAWNTNGLASVTSSNASQWKQLLDAGDRHLFRARGKQGEMAFLDQEPTWTSTSLKVPVRVDSMMDGLTLKLYASRSPDAWYFEDRWEKTLDLGTVGEGAAVKDGTFTGIDTTADWYVSARLYNAAGTYDQWTDPVKFTPQVVQQPPAGAVTVGTPTFTSNTATVNVTSLGDGATSVAISLVYASSDGSQTVNLGSLSAVGEKTATLSQLAPGTTYSVTATLTGSPSGLVTELGPVTFTTPAYTAPVIASVTTSAAEADAATISVNVSSLGQGSGSATVKVFVSTSDQFGDTPAASGTISAAGTATYSVTGLQAATAYFVKVVVTGSNGLSAQNTSASFVTGTVEPPAGTLSVSDVGRNYAVATVALTSLGDKATSVAVAVEVSTDSAFSAAGTRTYAGESVSGAGATQTVALDMLSSETRYYVRAKFTGEPGGLVGYSETVEFTTLGVQGPEAALLFNQISFEGATAVVRVNSIGDDATSASIALEIADNAAMENATGVGSQSGAQVGDASFTLAELQPGRTYWVRATVTGEPSGLATVVEDSFSTLAYGTPVLGTVSDATTFTTVSLSVPVTDFGAGSDSVELVVTLTEDSHYLGGTAKTATLSKPGTAELSWDGLEAGTTYYWTAVATGANGLSSTQQGQVQTPFHALALGTASATPADDGRTATLSVELLNLQSPPAVVTLYVDGVEVRSEGGITSARTFDWQIGIDGGKTYQFEFRATAGGETVVAGGSFTAPSVRDWFNVQWSQDGYAEGTAWNTAAAVGASGGSWTRPADDESSFDGTRLVLVPPEENASVLRFTPTNAVSNASSFTIRGETVISTGASASSVPPAGAIGSLVFLEEGPAVWTGEGWTRLLGDVPESGSTVSWKLDVKVSGDGAPSVRYTINGTVRSTAEEMSRTWIPLPAATKTVAGIGFSGGGKVGDFRGYYVAIVGRYERPHIGTGESGTGGSPISVVTDPATSATTFSISIDNATDDADYAVYAADEVTGPYRLVENPVIEGNGDLRTFSIAVKSDVKSQFFIVVAATPGYAFPYDFADIQDPQE